MSGAAGPRRPAGRVLRLVRAFACVVVLLLGLGFAVGAWLVVAEQRRLEAAGETVEGIVTRIESRRDTRFRSRAMEHRPVLRFRTRQGTDVETVAGDRIQPDAMRAGEAVRVTYDPADPSAPRLASMVEAGPGATPWTLAALAVLLVLAGGWGLRRVLASR